ncbi:MAG TPA: exopolysaccharide transport family protein [Beijerinckiaceae bacterium]|nr:exopolysaccharide transport family protein [Beijerinckiaceae bacterium]
MRDEWRPMSDEAYEAGGGDLDLRALGGALKRKRAWIAGVTLLAFIGALVFVLAVKPRYTADSQVLLENQENFLTKPDNMVNPAQAPDAEAVASQIQLVTSRDLARKAIDALRLKNDPEFNPPGGGLLARLAVLVGLERPASATSEEDHVLKNYYDRLTVFQIMKSRVLQIEFTSQDPELAARAANTIANLYIKVQIAAKHALAKSEAASLAIQIAGLRARLSAAEEKAESFRASSGMLLGDNNVTLTTQQLADLNAQLVAARTAEAEAQAKAKLIRSMLAKRKLDQVSDVANNALVRRLAEQRVTLRAQLALELRTLLPGHPKIQALEAQVHELDHELRNAAANVARGLENDSNVAGARVDSIRSILDQQKQAVGKSGVDAVRLRELDRDAKLIRDQLEASTTRYQQAVERETSTSTPGDARVISRAMAPENPSFPRRMPIVIFATLAGLALSSAAIMAGALLSAAPHDSSAGAPIQRNREEEANEDEQERAEDLDPAEQEAHDPAEQDMWRAADAALARRRVEKAGAENVGVRASDPGEAREEDPSLKLVERVLAAREPGRATCALVAGLTESAGAGAAAVQLGRALVREGRTILVELRQGLLSGAGLEKAEHCLQGLGELLDGELSFAEVIHRDDLSRLHFIVAGSAAAHAGEPLDVAVEALGETYDHVILLAAPAGADPLALQLAGSADVAAIVTGGRRRDAKTLDARADFSRAGAGEVVLTPGPAAHGRANRVSAA